jgi:zinc protease
VPERNWPNSPPLNSLTSVELEDESLRQASVQTMFRAPSYRQNRAEALALEVLAEIMGGGSTSRLYKSLVIEQQLASSAGLSYRPENYGDARATLYAAPLPEQDIHAVQAAYETELRKLISAGVTDAELEDAKTKMQDAAVYARDSLTGPAMVFGYGLTTGSSIDDIEYWPRDIGTVTAADVQDVAAKYLNPDQPYEHPPVTGYLKPKPQVPDVPTEPAQTGDAP